MGDTSGTVDLKIAQLLWRRGILRQRLALSTPYPQLQTQLIQEGLQIEWQLQSLQQQQNSSTQQRGDHDRDITSRHTDHSKP